MMLRLVSFGGATLLAALLAPQLDLKVDQQQAMLEFSPAEIRLEDLSPNEERRVEVAVHNRGNRSLNLSPPGSGCGCISPTLESFRLSPGQQTKLHFTYRAPATPGMVERSVALETHQSDTVWQLPVQATVQTDVWVSPTRLKLKLSNKESAKKSARIHLRNGKKIGRIE